MDLKETCKEEEEEVFDDILKRVVNQGSLTKLSILSIPPPNIKDRSTVKVMYKKSNFIFFSSIIPFVWESNNAKLIACWKSEFSKVNLILESDTS